MIKYMRAARASALIVGLALAGCNGGSGGSVVSTPTPTPASYTKIADMTGDRTFQTGGVQYRMSDPLGFSNGVTEAFGSGITIAYTAGTDSYKFTAPDGTTTTVTPQNSQPAPPDAPNDRYWSNQETFEVREFLSLTVPSVNGVALSYTALASWSRLERSKGYWQNYLAVGGAPTLASDMPRTGSATYSAMIDGSAMQGGGRYSLGQNSSATFAANFGGNWVTTSLTLEVVSESGGAVTSLGTFNGTGAISSLGPGFSGTLNGSGASGAFSGAFFGPKAIEMAFDWYLSGSDFAAVGAVAGIKK